MRLKGAVVIVVTVACLITCVSVYRQSSMQSDHTWAAIGATVGAYLLLLGMLIGRGVSITDINNVSDLRTICIAMWTFLVPVWFTVESMVWGPSADDTEGLTRFYHGQDL